ncbi:polyprenyl synthetase family protein [bacterium]|nr:polyprenyl synthetase family protein [bacterium]
MSNKELYLKYKDYIDNLLKRFIDNNYSGTFAGEVEYAVFSGGKRLRPVIMLAIADEFGVKKEIQNALIGIEFIHTYSLIQDDLPAFDNDDLRRGKETLHKKFNEYSALLTSDLLLTDALYLFSYYNRDIIELVRKKAGIYGLLSGQLKDMTSENLDFDTIIDIFKRKTLSLFEISFFVPILLKGDRELYENIFNDVEKFGIAFQMYNDLKSEKDENKGILSLYDRKDAKKIFLEYLNESKKILKYFKNSETKKIFEHIFELEEDL